MWLLDLIDNVTDWIGVRRLWRIYVGVAMTFAAIIIGVRFFDEEKSALWFMGIIFVVGVAATVRWHNSARDA